MKFASAYRGNAQDCLALAEQAEDGLLAARHKRMADAWYVLATEQEFLDSSTGHDKETPSLPDGTLDLWKKTPT